MGWTDFSCNSSEVNIVSKGMNLNSYPFSTLHLLCSYEILWSFLVSFHQFSEIYLPICSNPARAVDWIQEICKRSWRTQIHFIFFFLFFQKSEALWKLFYHWDQKILILAKRYLLYFAYSCRSPYPWYRKEAKPKLSSLDRTKSGQVRWPLTVVFVAPGRMLFARHLVAKFILI